MQHYSGVNILRLNHEKNYLSRVLRANCGKLSCTIDAFCVRVTNLRNKFKFLQHDILKR